MSSQTDRETTLAAPGALQAETFSSRLPSHTIPLIALGLAALTFAAYFPILHNNFISYDDPDYITNNALVRGGLSWHGIVQAFSSIDQANWFPLEWISLMGTSQWFGINAMAFHVTNLALHVANVVMLFLLLDRATSKTGRSAAVAALFSVLPLNVEAVAWATERKSVLSVFFLLLALAAYGRYAREPQPARYALVAIPFAFGLMTKAWLVTFPFALLLLDYWPLQRFGPRDDPDPPHAAAPPSFRQLVLEKIPLLVMALSSVAVGVYAARAGGAFSISAAHAPMRLRLENAVMSYFMYILKGVWPAHLAIIYPFSAHYYPAWRVMAVAVFLLLVTALFSILHKRRYLIVGWLWYLGLLFPVIGPVQTGTQAMADRWAYISFWGLFVAAAWLVADSAERMTVPRPALALTAAAVITAYGFISFIQTGYWRDSITLYSHALDVTKDNGPVRVNLGIEYEKAGRSDLAFEQFRQAVVDTPSLGIAHYNLARLLLAQHRLIEAGAEYRLAISNTGVPREISDAHLGLGSVYAEMGLPARAIEEFNAALAANPDELYALLDRGMIEFRQGDLRGAEKDFARSTQLAPTAMTWYTLGLILEDERNLPAAAQAYQAALRMNPNLKDARQHLGEVQR